MKISKTQLAIIISVCVLLAIVILSLSKAGPKPPATAPEAVTQEEPAPQTGKYELPPAQESAGYPASAYPESTQAGKTPSAASTPLTPATTGTLTEDTQNGNDGLSGGAGGSPQTYPPSPDLPDKPPKMPPPETLKEMQRQGIVAY